LAADVYMLNGIRKAGKVMKKYEFTGEILEWCGRTLKQIRALRDFGKVKAGDIGGWIEKEENLSHEGDCWVYDLAKVYDSAVVKDSAIVRDLAEANGSAVVSGSAVVRDLAEVNGSAVVSGSAVMNASVVVRDSAVVKTTRDYITISPIGSRDDNTTVFRTDDGIRIRCGCFYGSIAEFEERVKKTHEDNQYAKEYLAFAELLKIRFGEE